MMKMVMLKVLHTRKGVDNMIYELIPIFNNVKSFYGKAQVQLNKTDNTEVYTLFSYDTTDRKSVV